MELEQLDDILLRRLYLQRYAAQTTNDVIDLLKPYDKKLHQALQTFVNDASESDFTALANQRRSNDTVQELLHQYVEIAATMRREVIGSVKEHQAEVIEKQMPFMWDLIGDGGDAPSTQGVATLPVEGLSVAATMAAGMNLFYSRLVSQTANSAREAPQFLGRLLRGTRARKFQDGLIYWRNRRVIANLVDQVIGSAASHVDHKVYKRLGVVWYHYTATLDLRVCKECAAIEAGSPYRESRKPYLPRHPNCRCIIYGSHSRSPVDVARPFVEDERSVKDIPKDQRKGIIGQTRRTMDEFIDSLPDAKLRRYLGPALFNMWRSGQISSMRDLINKTTMQPLRIDQIP